MSIWREFFEDEKGRGSASRFNMILGVIVGGLINLSWPFLYKAPCGKEMLQMCASPLPAEIFVGYLLATGGVYGFNKYRESAEKIEQIRADSPNPPVPSPVPTPAPAPSAAVIIQNGPAPANAKDVNLTAEGDVNVNQS